MISIVLFALLALVGGSWLWQIVKDWRALRRAERNAQ